jgi:Co/Zn/Cd efflux system component
MFTQLILILLILAAFSLVYWAVQQFALPQPMKVIILVILGLVGLVMIWNFVAGGGVNLHLR